MDDSKNVQRSNNTTGEKVDEQQTEAGLFRRYLQVIPAKYDLYQNGKSVATALPLGIWRGVVRLGGAAKDAGGFVVYGTTEGAKFLVKVYPDVVEGARGLEGGDIGEDIGAKVGPKVLRKIGEGFVGVISPVAVWVPVIKDIGGELGERLGKLAGPPMGRAVGSAVGRVVGAVYAFTDEIKSGVQGKIYKNPNSHL